MPMEPLRFPVAVLMQRTPVTNRWISERWEPLAIEPETGAEGHSAPYRIDDDSGLERWRFSGHRIELHPTEAEGYFLNLAAPEPKVFVMWRKADEGDQPGARPWIVTVSYNQAARMLDGGEQVDAIALPDALRAWIEPFVAENYKPEPRRKARRNDPFANGESGSVPRD